jgi:hypothetical protein
MEALVNAPLETTDRTTESFARCEVLVAPAPVSKLAGAVAVLFICLWILLNLASLGVYDLAPDEAHYWQWSRHLDWSYYSKGPLVAWLIRISCELFGNEVFAVRLPAVLSSAALLAGLYRLIADVLGDRRLALVSIMCASTLPGVSAGAMLMTIDPPFLACWCWSLVGVNRALNRSASPLGWWLFAGACSALGVLAKYPMLLLPAAVLGHLLFSRRREFRRPGIWCFLTLTAFGCVPICVWNAHHHGVSFRHVLEQAGMGGESSASWLNPFVYLAGQAGILLGFWFGAVAAGARRFWRTCDPGLSLVWWSSAPVWTFYLLASFGSPGQANWPAASYIGGAVLAAAWVRECLAGRHRRLVLVGVIAASLLGLDASFALRNPSSFRPALASLVDSPSETNPTPIRKLDATCRLQGWQALADTIGDISVRVQEETKQTPALAGMLWTIPGELSFYCGWRPEVYSFGSALADRHSQYDIWRPNPVDDPERFRGRTFIYVGDPIPNAERVFERVEPPIRFTHREAGVAVASWTIWVCHGYRGFPKRQTRTDY